MQLTIKQRFRPFSHRLENTFVLPGYRKGVQVTPTTFDQHVFHDCFPVDQWTALLDLERGGVRVFGRGNGKHFCHESRLPNTFPFYAHKRVEKIFCGVTKSQNIESMWQRGEMQELLPIFFALTKWYGHESALQARGPLVSRLLDGHIEFVDFLRAAFTQGFVPQSFDAQGLGYHEPVLDHALDPFVLMPFVYAYIKGLFVHHVDSSVYLFPRILQSLPFGKAVGLRVDHCCMDLEWSKKKPRRVHLRTEGGVHTVRLCFPSWIKTFRCNGVLTHNREEVSSVHQTFVCDQFMG